LAFGETHGQWESCEYFGLERESLNLGWLCQFLTPEKIGARNSDKTILRRETNSDFVRPWSIRLTFPQLQWDRALHPSDKLFTMISTNE
jgi:hypothetical protein